MKKGDQSKDDPRDEEERLLMRHWTSPHFWCSPPDMHRFPSQRDRSTEDDHRQSRFCSRWSPPVVFKEPLLKDCPELITHLGAERPVLGKCLKAVFDQFRGHGGQDVDDCPQIKASGIGTLDSLQFAEEEVGTGLGIDPFHCLNDLDAFLPIVLAVDQKAQEEDPCLYPPLMEHEPQGSQPRTKYPIIIRKGMLQNIVDGELRRIEETFLCNPGLIPRQVFGVHDRISEHGMFLVIFARAG